MAERRNSGGSSPRSRGTLWPRCGTCCEPRFIPALAGNTLSTSAPPGDTTVHPRARGEHAGAWLVLAREAGSSPRSRGTPGQRPQRPGPQRFIPALAGNTWSHRPGWCRCAVHPRARGEHPVGAVPVTVSIGSSPRSRGTLSRARIFMAPLRFIPALAGNTGREGAPTPTRPVHPRARGEHPPDRSMPPPRRGSSPRSRGTPRAPRR